MIKKLEVDLSKVSGYIDGEEFGIITSALRKNNFYSKNFLYSVFNTEQLSQLEETGNYRNPIEKHKTIFAFTKKELVWDDCENFNSLRVCLNQYIFPAIAIYSGDCFFRNESLHMKYEHEFKNPKNSLEALEAILLIK